ncbi:MAG TPA: DUF3883 domain-containing protein [Ferruginibacter sp.]|jgi:hypothetical protein|nr:DUF3883 domain-containing protein [Ferruginibacter sp.]
MSIDWTVLEVEIIIADYFKMLHQELEKEKYNKTSHRGLILPMLNNRSEGSVEFKHQNISAVLAEMGVPFIKGYKPRFNYQQLLADEVIKYISNNKQVLEPSFEKFSNDIVIAQPKSLDFERFLDDEPSNSVVNEIEPTFKPIKINYLEKEQNNRRLGEEGERLIIEYEKWRLITAGKESLADKVEWVSKDLGDGTGFDILSKNNNGTDRFIEVKTTKLTKETPIYLTNNEVRFAEKKLSAFYLYRVFNFDSFPQFFMKHGNYQSFCQLKPQTFKGFF